MSNHMANSVNWMPEIRSSATRTIVAAGIAWPMIRSTVSAMPSAEPDDRHHDPEEVEEDERVEVADHVLLAHPPEEALEQQPGDARDDLAERIPDRSPTL